MSVLICDVRGAACKVYLEDQEFADTVMVVMEAYGGWRNVLMRRVLCTDLRARDQGSHEEEGGEAICHQQSSLRQVATNEDQSGAVQGDSSTYGPGSETRVACPDMLVFGCLDWYEIR